MDERAFDPTLPVLDVIAKLLLVALPAELRASASDLAVHVAQHPYIAVHTGKRWGA